MRRPCALLRLAAQHEAAVVGGRDQQIGRLGQSPHRFVSARDRDDDEPRLTQAEIQNPARRFVVVDDENAGSLLLRSCGLRLHGPRRRRGVYKCFW